ncbi:MAG: hypothetical protein methR_P1022 [Methyloprofundus sp.]|nr:MAG: hypothetical protein methR_P1022 [Methyloprofundus sp.]
MKIFLTSDIHTERSHKRFLPDFDYDFLRFSYPQSAGVIVLAGDIGEWVNGIEWARYRFKNKEIIYVPGNHEYYDSDLAIIDDMREKAAELDIHLLDNDAIIINGIRFLGATLWTDFNRYSRFEIDKAKEYLNDYRYISCRVWWSDVHKRTEALSLIKLEGLTGFDPEYFSPMVAYLLHMNSVEWLGQQLSMPFHGKTVVVTHHAPSMLSCHIENYAYASDLESFIEKYAATINVWCHGHIHRSVDYKVAGVRIVSNPRGYPFEAVPTGFDNEKLICV